MAMSPVLNLTVSRPNPPLTWLDLAPSATACSRPRPPLRDWASLQQRLKSNGRFSCLFSDNNRREEQARKALEGALGGKKSEFEKWDKEIKRREEAGGGDGSGGGWFGWGGRFGWSNGDNFWQEAQQLSLTILGIICVYFIIAKGEVLLAVIFNPLLFALRGARNSLTFATSQILRRISPNTYAQLNSPVQKGTYTPVSAKEEVLRKWGNN